MSSSNISGASVRSGRRGSPFVKMAIVSLLFGLLSVGGAYGQHRFDPKLIPGAAKRAIQLPASAYAVYGAIGERYAQLGGESGPLGAPTSDEAAASFGGRFNSFQHGFIYWHEETGAHGVWGLIGEKWNQLGREQFGYPINDESVSPDGRGRYNHFRALQQPGKPEASIFFTPETGAHAVYGAIRDKWIASGWERGPLGYPTSDEFQDGPYRRTNFERGYIRWSPSGGAELVVAAPSPASGGLAPRVRTGADGGIGDQYLPMVGTTDAAYTRQMTARCAPGRIMVGLDMRAGDLVDHVAPVCANATGETTVTNVRTDGGGFGGDGGSPQGVGCPTATPAILKAQFLAEGVNGLGLHNIYLYCGVARDGAQSTTENPNALYESPSQLGSYGILTGRDPVPAQNAVNQCPDGLVAVGVYGKSWNATNAYVSAIGLICGPPIVGP